MHHQNTRRGPAPWLAIVAACALLGACDKGNDRTVGQQVDRGVAATERAAADVKQNAKEAAAEARTATSNAAESVKGTAADISITSKVNAELAADPSLSALSINVDTKDGRVALNGTAPDDAARQRATSLAKSVQGVVDVDNRLEVQPKS